MRLFLNRNIFIIFFDCLFLFAAFLLLVYLLPQSPKFPSPPPDSVQSLEEADTETPLRRAYFTNFNREQVIDHYKSQVGKINLFGIQLPIMRLNYPPEDSQILIRDQVKSTFLEELTHPFRESIFINGFKPSEEKDDIWYKGVHYNLKITVRYIPSQVILREIVGLLCVGLLYVIMNTLIRQVILIFKSIKTLIRLR